MNTQVDKDDPALAATLWDRVKSSLPTEYQGWQPCMVNERLRVVRYEVGERTTIHFDGPFTRSPTEKSIFTLMVYLNEDFTGGQTNFYRSSSYEPSFQVQPKTGTAVLFDHRFVHEGSVVTQGTKLILRTDVMFTRQSS